jgi:hypothetical protein
MRISASFALLICLFLAAFPSRGEAQEMTTICAFTFGPRAGTMIDYIGRPAFPANIPCNDGVSSGGLGVPTGNGNPSLPPRWQAGGNCDYVGNCSYFVNFGLLPQVTAQQTNVWCWAAAAQTIFKFYGHDVPQATIVQTAYGTVEISEGQPVAMMRMLNADYSGFRVSTPQYFDALGLMDGTLTLPVTPGLTWPDVFNSLASGHPVFYADQQHAMVMVGAEATGATPVRIWVLDPAPIAPIGWGPIIDPRIPAVGLRTLSPQEMAAFFVVEVLVQ